MDYTISCFTWSFWDTDRIPHDQASPSQTHRCPDACGSRQKGHVVIFHILPTGIHGLCFGFCFSGPLPPHSLLHGPLSRVHFGESLVIRLYSEIEQIHLSSEAQCVSHHLPLVDCRNCNECNLYYGPICTITQLVALHCIHVCPLAGDFLCLDIELCIQALYM